jgi:hypothetical protein
LRLGDQGRPRPIPGIPSPPGRLADPAAALAGVIHAGEALRVLDLRCNGITEDGAALLLEALEDNHALKLDLGRGIGAGLRGRLRALLARNRAAGTAAEVDAEVAAIRSVYRTVARS